jgi:hypothetical protein
VIPSHQCCFSVSPQPRNCFRKTDEVLHMTSVRQYEGRSTGSSWHKREIQSLELGCPHRRTR